MTYEWHGDGKKICYMCYFVFLSLEKILHTSNIGISLQLFWMNYSANIKFLESKKDIYDDDGIEKGALSTHYMKFHWILHDATDNYFLSNDPQDEKLHKHTII